MSWILNKTSQKIACRLLQSEREKKEWALLIALLWDLAISMFFEIVPLGTNLNKLSFMFKHGESWVNLMFCQMLARLFFVQVQKKLLWGESHRKTLEWRRQKSSSFFFNSITLITEIYSSHCLCEKMLIIGVLWKKAHTIEWVVVQWKSVSTRKKLKWCFCGWEKWVELTLSVRVESCLSIDAYWGFPFDCGWIGREVKR